MRTRASIRTDLPSQPLLWGAKKRRKKDLRGRESVPIIDVTGKPPVHMQTMKTQTKIDRISQFVQLQELRTCRDKARTRLVGGIDAVTWKTEAEMLTAYNDYTGKMKAYAEAEEAWKRRDSASRAWAEQQVKTVTEFVRGKIRRETALQRSGSVEFVVEWTTASRPYAQTLSSVGEQYSRRCTYRKTDATHIVRLSHEWAAEWNQVDADASMRDGIALVGLKADRQACWLTIKNRSLHLTQGWFVVDGANSYHSEVSLEHAKKGLAKKVAAWQKHLAQEAQRRAEGRKKIDEYNKAQRRMSLVARFCDGLKATIADAKELGFCDVGIQQFQNRFGIGDSATLPELVKTGDPSATRLAFHLARKAIATSTR